MANYVSNKVICTKKFFDKYFIDPYSLGKKSYEYCKEHKYISFNNLFGVKNVNEYYDKYGEYIYYGCFYNVKEISDELVEINFKTKHYYPISAIKKAIELEHDIIWYCVEENLIYISKFLWDKNGVVEKVLNIENEEFNDWYDNCNIKYDSSADDIVWYYKPKNNKWIVWECDDLIKKYKNKYPYNEYYEWVKKLNKNMVNNIPNSDSKIGLC